MTEWVWVLIVIWIFVLIFGYVSKDVVIRMISGLSGIIFGILYLSTSAMVGMILIGLNMYILYSSIEAEI